MHIQHLAPVLFYQLNLIMGKKAKTKHVVLTGGGTLGHVMPNLVLIKRFQKLGWKITYIGSKNGPEKEAIQKLDDVQYISIRTGKLRRYFSWQNFLDIFNVFLGIVKSFFVLLRLRPNVTFSKGGFVALPVVLGSWMSRTPVVIHESDMTPGLTTKLSQKFARKICVAFKNTEKYFPPQKVVYTGLPVRDIVYNASPQKGLEISKFSGQKPIILVFGGSMGAQFLNTIIRDNTKNGNLANFDVINICGKNNLDEEIENQSNYIQFESLGNDFLHIMACADIVVSRGGATSLFELMAMKKPHVIIPLSKKASRGDQIDNAKYFHSLGVSEYIMEEDCDWSRLYDKIQLVTQNKVQFLDKVDELDFVGATQNVLKIIQEESK